MTILHHCYTNYNAYFMRCNVKRHQGDDERKEPQLKFTSKTVVEGQIIFLEEHMLLCLYVATCLVYNINVTCTSRPRTLDWPKQTNRNSSNNKHSNPNHTHTHSFKECTGIEKNCQKGAFSNIFRLEQERPLMPRARQELTPHSLAYNLLEICSLDRKLQTLC